MSIQPGEIFSAGIVFDVAPGWTIYGERAGKTGLPTTISWTVPKGFSAKAVRWPAAPTAGKPETVPEYSGRIVLLCDISAPVDAKVGESASIGASVAWLACANACVPGKAELSITLPISQGTPSPDPGEAALFSAARARLGGTSERSGGIGLLTAIVLAFAGGLLLNLMPCVLPVISLKVLSLRKRSAAEGKSTALHGAFFAAGVLASFWALAALLIVLRAGGLALGWGFQLQDPVFVALMACVFFLISLNLFGVFEVGASMTRLGSGASRAGGLGGSFLVGLVAVLVATPCAAPFMGPAVGYALVNPAASAFAVFSSLALGFAAPVFALSAVGNRLRRPAPRVPRSGRWNELLRAGLGFPMAASVAWLAYVLAELAGARAVVALMWSCVALGLGAWVLGAFGTPDRPPRSRIAAAAFAAILIAGGAAVAVLGSVPSRASARETAEAAPVPSANLEKASEWRPWSPEAEAELRRAGVPVLVDFTARWCLTCEANEAFALGDARVRERLELLGVATLRADWTARDDRIAAELASFGRAGVPLYVLYGPGAPPRVLPQILTPGIVLDALDEAVVGEGR